MGDIIAMYIGYAFLLLTSTVGVLIVLEKILWAGIQRIDNGVAFVRWYSHYIKNKRSKKNDR